MHFICPATNLQRCCIQALKIRRMRSFHDGMCATASTLSVFQRRRLDSESMSNDKKGARYAWFKANRSNVHD